MDLKYYKVIIFILTFLYVSSTVLCQNNAVGIGTTNPDASSILELLSSEKGFLIPSMTKAERDAIASPATGLIIQQTDNIKGFYYWDGSIWLWIVTELLGDYVYGTGDATQVAYWTTSKTISGDDGLFFDETNDRLGIGTTTPNETLELAGGLIVGNTTNTNSGAIRWSGLDFEGYVGTEWKSFTKYPLSGEGEPGQVSYWESSTFIGGDNSLFYDETNGRLGIGTMTPRSDLEVNGGIRIGNSTNTNPGTVRWTGADFEGYDGIQWLSLTSSTLTGSGTATQVTYWNSPSNLTGDNGLYWDHSNTFLGIGTTTPREAFDINGGIKVGNTSPSTSTVTGTFRWTGSDFEGYIGSDWLSFTQVSGMNGSGTNGQVTYWSGTLSLAGDDGNYFDWTNKRLGVGTTSPTHPLTVDGVLNIGGEGESGELSFFSEQGATDYRVYLKPSSTMSENTTYTLPADPGINENALIADGTGGLYWDDPTVALGDYWELNYSDNVLQTVGNWGIARYSATITGVDVVSQINFGVTSTSNGSHATILGGLNNTAIGDYSFIYGGENNYVNSGSGYSAVLGGSSNTISGQYSRVAGYGNNVTGDYSVLSGGQNLTLSGSRSYVFRGGVSTSPYVFADDDKFSIIDANFHFNENNGDNDFQVQGQTDNNLLFVDASADGVGIGTNTPSYQLEVEGNVALTNSSGTASQFRFAEPSGGGTSYSSFSASSQTATMNYKLPSWHNVENSALFNDANGNLEWASPEQVAGWLRSTVVITTTDYTPTSWNVHIVVNNTAETTVTLPPAADLEGKRYFIKKTGTTGAGRVYIQPDGYPAVRIDGMNSNKTYLNQQYEGVMVVSDGINWYVFAKFDG